MKIKKVVWNSVDGKFIHFAWMCVPYLLVSFGDCKKRDYQSVLFLQ
jgi:hypothetical protein